MSSVYIISDHGKLGKKNDALCFTGPDGTERRLFIHRADRIVIAGTVEITGAAMRMLMHHAVDTIFLSSNGRFNGKLQFEEGKNVLLRKRQYDSLNEPAFVLEAARSLATGKVKNQIAFMQRISRKGTEAAMKQAIMRAKSNEVVLQSATDVNEIRGYEGFGARLFFSVFRQNIDPDWAHFNGRSMHPPKDNVNAVMSFLYTLLLYRIDAFVEMEGLDPYVGYLHSLEYAKRSLSFDLMEEFRTIICDTLTCALFNLGILTAKDFEMVDFSVENDDAPMPEPDPETGPDDAQDGNEKAFGVLLTKEGARKVAKQFEDKLDTLVMYQPENARISYEQVMAAQVSQFKRFLLGQETAYKPFVVR